MADSVDLGSFAPPEASGGSTQLGSFTPPEALGGSSPTAAVTASASTTNALGAALTKVFSDPKVISSIGNAAGGAFGAIENLFGIQTPEQQKAAAAAAAAAAQQQQMLIIGGVIVAVIGIAAIGYVVMRRK